MTEYHRHKISAVERRCRMKECEHKWIFQEKQLKTRVTGYENHFAHYHRIDIYFCEKCCEIKKVEQTATVSLPYGGIHNVSAFAPIWYQ